MIVVDTSVWVDHLRAKSSVLLDLIAEERILHHPFVTAELALGSLPDSEQFCCMLLRLPQIDPLPTEELMTFVVHCELFGTGLGMVEAHLLASANANAGAKVWSSDKRLVQQATRLGIAFKPG